MRTPEFEAMISPAKLYPELWRLLLGVLLVVFIYAAFIAFLLLGVFAATGPLEYFGFLRKLNPPVEPLPTLLVLGTTLGLLLGVLIATPACHLRAPGTLFGPRDEVFRGFGLALATALPLYALMTLAGFYLEGAVPNLALAVWLKLLPATLVLLLLQVSGEELLFRGYLPQQLAARFRSRAVWMILPALLFAALHWNPAAGNLATGIVATTFVFALIAADLTERTGSLGAAIGLHFVNNIFAASVLSVKGSVTGLALWTTHYGVDEPGPLGLSLAFNIVFLLVVWRALRWAIER